MAHDNSSHSTDITPHKPLSGLSGVESLLELYQEKVFPGEQVLDAFHKAEIAARLKESTHEFEQKCAKVFRDGANHPAAKIFAISSRANHQNFINSESVGDYGTINLPWYRRLAYKAAKIITSDRAAIFLGSGMTHKIAELRASIVEMQTAIADGVKYGVCPKMAEIRRNCAENEDAELCAFKSINAVNADPARLLKTAQDGFITLFPQDKPKPKTPGDFSTAQLRLNKHYFTPQPDQLVASIAAAVKALRYDDFATQKPDENQPANTDRIKNIYALLVQFGFSDIRETFASKINSEGGSMFRIDKDSGAITAVQQPPAAIDDKNLAATTPAPSPGAMRALVEARGMV